MEQNLQMPQVDFFGTKISRLILGGNPFNGGSHVGPELDAEMDTYYSVDNIKKAIRHAREYGINTTLLSGNHLMWKIMREMEAEGDRPNWIANTAPHMASFAGALRQILAAKPMAVYHHGTDADQLFAAGQTEVLRERFQLMRDTGLPVGLGTHNPRLVEYAQEHDWDVDFYMTCVYNILKYNNRPSSSITGIANQGEAFEDGDVPVMLDVVRQTPKPCLVFKILGATRKCKTDEMIAEQFRNAFAHMKPTDCVVVGMFQRDRDQIAMNAALTAQYGQL